MHQPLALSVLTHEPVVLAAQQVDDPRSLGRWIESIQKRDYPVVQGCVLFVSLTYVLVNTLTDLAYGLIDPRIRQARTSR